MNMSMNVRIEVLLTRDDNYLVKPAWFPAPAARV